MCLCILEIQQSADVLAARSYCLYDFFKEEEKKQAFVFTDICVQLN